MKFFYAGSIMNNFLSRLVYKWFYFIYKLSYTLGVLGYFVLLATFFGLNLVFNQKPQLWMDCGILLIVYGLYYGVLGRDLAEISADKMASHIGVSDFHLIITLTELSVIFQN